MAAGYPEVSPFAAGLSCRCPRCGRGPLFKGLLSLEVRPACDACALQFRFVDSGDGPAVFAILILGFLLLGAALFVEFRLAPPWWVHVVLWVPLTLFVALGFLRPMKATLVALQYRHKAAEGRLDRS